MRLRRTRGDAETLADLLVRAPGGDQLDDLPLPLGDRRALASASVMTAKLASLGAPNCPKGVFRGVTRRRPCADETTPRAHARSPRVELSSSSAPMRLSKSNSSRRCVRIISGPSVAIVNATPWSMKVRNVSRTASSSGSAFVSRLDVGQISSTMSALSQCRHQLGVAGGEDAVADAVGPQRLDDLADLVASDVAALLADVDRHTEAGVARLLDHRRRLAVVVAAAVRARAGDVDADDSARRPPDRLLDDDRVLLGGEGPVHHQDQSRPHLRVLEARAVEAADRREDDVVEVALAAAVPLHRVEAKLERRDPLRPVSAADRGVHRALDGDRARLDQLRPVVDLVERVEVRDAARVQTVTSRSNSQ